VQAAVLQQVTYFTRHHRHPVAAFRAAADYLRSQRWEVPTYGTLAGLVTEAFRTVERHSCRPLAQHLLPAV
jgi:hypothetical protein